MGSEALACVSFLFCSVFSAAALVAAAAAAACIMHHQVRLRDVVDFSHCS